MIDPFPLHRLHPDRPGHAGISSRHGVDAGCRGNDESVRGASEGFSDWHCLVLDRTGAAGGYFYDKPVVVLSDSGCFSATGIFLGALSGRPRVTLVGQPSGGGNARTQGFRLSDSRIEVRGASLTSFGPDGHLHDGRGVEVDVMIELEPDCSLEEGRDVVLDAAPDIIWNE